TPSSSGPRCTIAWHMARMVAASILEPRSAPTIPAIPHIFDQAVVGLRTLQCTLPGFVFSLDYIAFRFSATHRNRGFYHFQIYQPAVLEPAKHLFVSVLGLIFRGIPIEGFEHSPLRIWMTIHWKNIVHDFGCRLSNTRNELQRSIHSVQHWDHRAEYAVQPLRSHAVGYFPVVITESIPLVVSAVQPDSEYATGLQVLRKNFECLFAVRRVVQYTNAINHVETLGLERQAEYIGLQRGEVSIGKIAGGDFRGSAQVNSHYLRPIPSRHFGISAGTASYIEHSFAAQFGRGKPCFPAKIDLGGVLALVVHLRKRVLLPLETKIVGVVATFN